MRTFSDSEFSLAGNDGIRMFFDMKGSGSLYFKVTGQQVNDLFCRRMGIRSDDCHAPDFVMEMLFTGVSWFSMGKVHGRESAELISSCGASNECERKKDVQLNFASSADASICLRIKYDQVTIRSVRG